MDLISKPEHSTATELRKRVLRQLAERNGKSTPPACTCWAGRELACPVHGPLAGERGEA